MYVSVYKNVLLTLGFESINPLGLVMTSGQANEGEKEYDGFYSSRSISTRGVYKCL